MPTEPTDTAFATGGFKIDDGGKEMTMPFPETIPSRVIDLFIPGEPVGQPRARATMRAGHAAVYNPTRIGKRGQQRQHPIVAWKQLLTLMINQQTPREPLAGPVSVHLVFYGSRPKSLMTKKANPDEMPDLRKPDVDNLAKAVMDVMKNCGVYNDDAQVWSLVVKKRYVMKDSERGPGVYLQVYDDYSTERTDRE